MPHMSVQYSHTQHTVPHCAYLHADGHLTYIPAVMCLIRRNELPHIMYGSSILLMHACRRPDGQAARMCAVVYCNDEHAFYISSPNRMWHLRKHPRQTIQYSELPVRRHKAQVTRASQVTARATAHEGIEPTLRLYPPKRAFSDSIPRSLTIPNIKTGA